MLATKKTHEGDLVQLTEDLEKYNLKRGDRGFVIEAFDEPNEAYDIEFEDAEGEFIGFGYSVRPSQIENVSASAKEALEQGIVSVTRKAHELDLVELTEDLPEFGLKRGERGTVVEAFDNPDEAYDIEFVDESGQSKFAYSVKPAQISTDALANELFEGGVALFESGRLLEAEAKLQKAIEMKTTLIRELHSLIMERLESRSEWQKAISALRFLVRVAPDYEGGRADLATTYMMHGVELANQDDIEQAIYFFDGALGVAPPAGKVSRIRSDLAQAYTRLAARANDEGDYEKALHLMRFACEAEISDLNRRNLGLAHALLATHLLATTQYEEAVENFERAMDAGFINAHLLNNYGVALASRGDLNLAAEEFERALRLEPDAEGINANLAKAKGGLEAAKPAFVTLSISDGFLGTAPMQPEPHVAA